MTQYLMPPVAAQPLNTPNLWTLQDTVANFAAVTASDYLGDLQLLGHNFQPQDFILVYYSGGSGLFSMSFDENIITLVAVTAGAVTYSGSNSTIGNLPSFSNLNGDIQDSNIPSDQVLQSVIENPDKNINEIVFQTGNITNSTMITGENIFVPEGEDTYIVKDAILNVTTSFSGGSDNAAIIFDVGSTDTISATSTIIKNTANAYNLGQQNFTNLVPTQTISAANPLKLKAQAGSDYTDGVANVRFYLEKNIFS